MPPEIDTDALIPVPAAAAHAAAARHRSLAWLALGSQCLLLLLLLPWWRLDPHLRRANLVVGLAAVLPVAATGIVGAVAELKQRAWGRLVSIIALALALLLELSYGITRLALVPDGRQGLALLCAGSWLITLLLLLERSLRRSPAPSASSSLAPSAGNSSAQPPPDRSTRPAAADLPTRPAAADLPTRPAAADPDP